MDRPDKPTSSVDPDSSGTSPDGNGAVGDTFPFPAAGGGGADRDRIPRGNSVARSDSDGPADSPPRRRTLAAGELGNPVPFDRPEGLVTQADIFGDEVVLVNGEGSVNPGGGGSGKKDVSGGPGGGDRSI